MQPIENNQRIDVLDYLRGFALLGIILVNIPDLLRLDIPKTSTDIIYHHFLLLFVEGKFFTIFSFLFGVGFYIFISRAKAQQKRAYLLFTNRLMLLLVMGIIHTFFNSGEALKFYAIYGLFALPFYKVRKEINLVISLILLALTAYFGIKAAMPLPLILLGLTAGQYHIFEKIAEHRQKIRQFTIVMFGISIVGLLYQWQYVPEGNVQFNELSEQALAQHVTNVQQFSLIGLQISPFVSAFYVGLLMLLLQYPFVKIALSPLQAYGQMALTNYLGQTALILLIGHQFDLMNTTAYIHTLWICIGIYIVQLLFSKLWLTYCRFGPMEWLWRMGTYWSIPPFLAKR
ncbi:DUF418 domain-containing protein [Lysinibacillus piscis]|uniref:DUF418 domain-containing protein n=1 Tax=Lysinibacillus piscis TaxID=2518931 RepID=UPI00222F12DA|nr:DUF418 domain-containing protein [Lysinibacillus sp. KH24]